MFRSLLHKLLPRPVLTSLANYRILSQHYGHYRSASEQQSVDRSGNPIPWYSYPMIEYLRQLDFSQKRVFEYGSGNSTRFWASCSQQVVSVEDDAAWFDKLRTSLPPAVDYRLLPDKNDYIHAIDTVPGLFDLISIDGSHRFACARAARPHLSPAGMIILDNADWFPQTTAFLRSTDLIEIDMAGFNPINGYVTTTSLFLSRQVDFRPIGPHQPQDITGGIIHYAD